MLFPANVHKDGEKTIIQTGKNGGLRKNLIFGTNKKTFNTTFACI